MKLIRSGLLAGLALLALTSVAGATTLPLASALSGLNAGDTYQFVFVTNGTIAATSTSLSTYNTFVQNAADAAGIGSSIGLTWKAMVSVGSGANNAAANAPVAQSTKVFLVNGTMVANGSTNPFYSLTETQAHLSKINVTELGTTLSSGLVWTGGNSNGSESGSGLLGLSPGPVAGDLNGVLAERTPGGWARQGNFGPNTTALRIYGISAPLVVSQAIPTPEPTTVSLLGLGIGGLLIARLRRKK